MDQVYHAQIGTHFPFKTDSLDVGTKYLGYFLKPNKYAAADWMWLLAKIEKRIKNWCYRWLSLERRLILVCLSLERRLILIKLVLEIYQFIGYP